MHEPAAERIAAFLARAETSTPDDAIAAAQLILLNGLRATLAARDEQLAIRLTSSHPVATRTGSGAAVFWSGLRMSPEQAAACNQFMWTMLLFDDVELTTGIHPGGAAATAALAIAAEHRVSGRRLLAAIVAGIEVQIAIGRAGSPEMLQKRGFAPLSVLAPLGAAAAGVIVGGVSREHAAHALGIAAMSGAGVWEMGGTSSATFLAARGTGAGLAALNAARCGVEAPERALDGEFGAHRAYTGKPVDSLFEQLASLGTDWRTTQVIVQPYSGDTYVQAALQAIALMLSHGSIDVEKIESVRVSTDERTALGVARKAARHPTISDALALNSDPSARVAAALLRGRYSWDGTFAELVHDPGVAALRSRVRFVHDPSIVNMANALVEVHLSDGKVRRARVDGFVGSAGDPQSYAGVSAWFRIVADSRIGPDRAQRLVELIASLPDATDVEALLTELI